MSQFIDCKYGLELYQRSLFIEDKTGWWNAKYVSCEILILKLCREQQRIFGTVVTGARFMNVGAENEKKFLQ